LTSRVWTGKLLTIFPGKSTLQNELIGDLGVEFTSLPDGAEDLSLKALASTLDGSFGAKPGKQISALISRCVASKMPAGFNYAAIKRYLETRWGLGEQQQLAVVCFALTLEPTARMSSVEEAKTFFDKVVNRYASYSGIDLAVKTTVAETKAIVNSVASERQVQLERGLLTKQLEVLKEYLQVDEDVQHNNLKHLTASDQFHKGLVDQWNAELDEVFLSGVKPMFDPRKAREYTSSWNWAREDLIHFINEIRLGRTDLEALESRRMQILGNWTESCSNTATFLTSPEQNAGKSILRDLGDDIVERGTKMLNRDPTFIYQSPPMAPKTTIDSVGKVIYEETSRGCWSGYVDWIEQGHTTPGSGKLLQMKHRVENDWVYDSQTTQLLLESLKLGVTSGLIFVGKIVLITGAGPNSIAAEVLRGLLSGGARVIVTTSRSPSSNSTFFKELYRGACGRNAKLTVLPFNQASKGDCEALVDHIYGSMLLPGEDLDYVLPFAAIPDVGEIDSLDGRSELAHRAMLVNVLRLLGLIRQRKERNGVDTRPTNVILPLSPNHGTFGGDGLYSESKLGLETLFSRFSSESWARYLTICGTVIGWTRGTGLMAGNDTLSCALEAHNVTTFSQQEMAFNIMALLTQKISIVCEDNPLYADFSGGLQTIPDLKTKITAAREGLREQSAINKALTEEGLRHETVLNGTASKDDVTAASRARHENQRANVSLAFPELPSFSVLTADTPNLQGMLDLERIVVVVGFSELGPWGNARTRWEREQSTDFSIEGYVEMAWIMGLVEHFDGEIDRKPYSGWVDTISKDPVTDAGFKEKYGEQITSHAGIRFIEPVSMGGYDTTKRELLHEVVVEHDLPPFEASKDTAESFRLRHGERVTIQQILGSDQYTVKVKKGAHFLVPKAVPSDRSVAGQLPKGWNPSRYGIPAEIISQVDPITLYALCCVSEAFYSAGIKDVYELYSYIHVSELANCLGTGAGPLLAMRGAYQHRYLDRQVQSDILQESFLNTMGAWINMLLLSSTGPIKSPVGACATAIESLDAGCEAVRSGKARVAVVGGCDDFQEEMSQEFASMKATCSTSEELSKGRTPAEMSRPCTTSRSGFVESAGCGVQIIMNAELALRMGLPIYGVVSSTQMAGDKIGRSVPAPGQGILSAGSEMPDAQNSPLLDLEIRRANLEGAIEKARKSRTDALNARTHNPDTLKFVEDAFSSEVRNLQNMWGNDIREQNMGISPIRAGLAAWGLTVDDIGVASMHGTSTKANDSNESDVLNKLMTHLGRTKGNPLLTVCQKSLTGHPKGAAGAWQFNGCLQMLQTGIVPGNRNLDDVDKALEEFEYLVYPSQTQSVPKIKATILTSFGFGQKGGITIAVAPRYLFAAISEADYQSYHSRVTRRQAYAAPAYVKAMMTKSIVQIQDEAVWGHDNESKTLLNSDKRFHGPPNNKQESCVHDDDHRRRLFHHLLPDDTSTSFDRGTDQDMTGVIKQMLDQTETGNLSIGVDTEDYSSIDKSDEIFIGRNFTLAEREYCERSADPLASFTGKWCAKEAVFKSMQVPSRGPGAAMAEIEIMNAATGGPEVQVCPAIW
jgi:fatty acid synthase subunit alpha